MPASPTSAPAEALARIIDALYRVVAAQIAGGRLAAPLIVLICGRLSRMKTRFAALAARVQQGTHAPRRRPAASTPRSRKPRDPAKRLPERFGWLVRLALPTAFGASQLAVLLADPEMLALITAAPQAGRILRPLCRMLGLRPQEPLRLQPPAAPEAPAPARLPRAPTPTPAEPPASARRLAVEPVVPHRGHGPPRPA